MPSDAGQPGAAACDTMLRPSRRDQGNAPQWRGRRGGALVVAVPSPAARLSGNDELAKALQDHVKQTIAPYKYPRAIEFVAQLPKTETGKLRRFTLRQMAAAGPSPSVAAE